MRPARNRRNALLPLLACALALAAGPPLAAQEAATPEPGATPELPPVVARVNGVEITRDDVLEHAAATRLRIEQAGAQQPQEDAEFYREIAEQLIGSQLLFEAAAAADLVPSDAELGERIGSLRGQFDSQEAYEEALASRGTSQEVLTHDLRHNLAIQKLVETAIAPGVTVDEAEERALYERNAADLERPEQVKLRHILVFVPEDAEPAAVAAARERADGIVARLAAGEEFGEVAREVSDDTQTAEAGGELPWMARGNDLPTFEQAAFSLTEPGEISDVVRTRFGFHLIRLDDRRAAGTIPFEEVQPQLHQHLMDQAVGRAMEERVDALRADAEIELFI